LRYRGNVDPIKRDQGQAKAHAGEFCCAKKKTSEKALIPLPPTGLASFFCANSKVVQTTLQTKPAVGVHRRSLISRFAKFGRKVQPGCTAGPRIALGGQSLQPPVLLGEKLENVGLSEFSILRSVCFGRC
jgi:hypothetical protein